MKTILKWAFAVIVLLIVISAGWTGYRRLLVNHQFHSAKTSGYEEIARPMRNIGRGRNSVEGVVLHYTSSRNAASAIRTLCGPKLSRSAHVVIDYDGTRYVLAPPTAITWHAGKSVLNGREWCNRFTIGAEFQGDTWLRPLTEEQINSAIEYLLPIIRQLNISLRNITTHAAVREPWNKKHPNNQGGVKVDIARWEYERFMNRLKKAMKNVIGINPARSSFHHPRDAFHPVPGLLLVGHEFYD